MKEKLEPSVKLCLERDGVRFFGPGTRELLEGIRQQGSLRLSCEQMGVSYSKGRKMLRKLEEMLDVPVVQCVRGGTAGGSTELTEQGERLLREYEGFETHLRDYARASFHRFFAEEGENVP